MKVRFLKGIASIFGTFEPGMVIDMPNKKIAASWLRNGIAEEVKGKGKGITVKPIPAVPTGANSNKKAVIKKKSKGK